MKTTFQCVRSGNLVSFDNEDDIAQLRIHEGYKEIKNESQVQETIQSPIQEVSHAHEDADEKVLKQRGRPRKK